MMNSRERFFTLIKGSTPDQLINMPITMMFAAHHIGMKYGSYALDHKFLAEAQIRTAETFRFDHVSVISETREAPDCGAIVRYYEDQPYTIDETCTLLSDKSKLLNLRTPSPYKGKNMSDRLEAIALLKEKCGQEKIIEGWLEGPIAAAADLRGIQTIMMDFFEDPVFIKELLEFTTEVGIAFAIGQLQAGADVLGIGDAAASLLGPELYKEFVWPMEKKLIRTLQNAGAKIRLHICGDLTPILEPVGKLGCEIVDIDSMVQMDEARLKLGANTILLGGLDPVRELLDCTPEEVRIALIKNHTKCGNRYIVGAGCEIPPYTPYKNLEELSHYAKQNY